ncbi:hypothetical protein C4K00_3718 [Pseudomonas synxantha]|uniref:DUF4393 domain-containing protein n=1 Tax=Pseudomonas synxantha TaxID=47883 RepID=UPI000F578E7D|nr:DUF4393 domain-containing protein [Pseudomonas synxantha]AZE73939.1 hypothetical protein C4K00_3718 [Pseudomonas synxantha]
MGEESGGDNNVKGTIDAVTGLVKAVPVYDDMVQPVAKQLGKTLETVGKAINMALSPVSGLVWGFENIQAFLATKLADRLKDVPPEDIITPKPNVAGPAIEALRFTGHEESLSDMYANLLAAAMDKNTAAGAHPAFVEIIKQLTPDEAKVLSLFSLCSTFPLITLQKQKKEEMGTVDVLVNFSHLSKYCHLDSPSLVPIYLDNLCRLGLLSIPEGQYLTAKDAYGALESDPEILRMKTIIESDSAFLGRTTQDAVRTTEFGRQFLKVCTLRKA